MTRPNRGRTALGRDAYTRLRWWADYGRTLRYALLRTPGDLARVVFNMRMNCRAARTADRGTP